MSAVVNKLGPSFLLFQNLGAIMIYINLPRINDTAEPRSQNMSAGAVVNKLGPSFLLFQNLVAMMMMTVPWRLSSSS